MILRIFIDDIFSKLPLRNYPTNNKICNHIDGIWSNDLVDFSGYKVSNKKGYRYIFVIIDSFSKYLWCIPLKLNVVKQQQKNFQKF